MFYSHKHQNNAVSVTVSDIDYCNFVTSCPTLNAGTNGTLDICTGQTVTAAELFAALGGGPDAGGMWTPALAGAGVYTYTVSAVGPCVGTDDATVTVSEVTCAVTGHIYEDVLGTVIGIQDAGEQPLSGVQVRAFNSEGVQLGDTKVKGTDVSYMMDYLGKDDYYLEFTPPSGYVPTSSNMGSDEQMDSDVDGSYGLNTTGMYVFQISSVLL